MRRLDVGPDRVEEGGFALALRRRVVCLFVGSVACPVLHAREDRGACRAGAGPEQGWERGGGAERLRATHRQRDLQWGAVTGGVGRGRERRAAGASRAVAPR